MIHSVRRYLGGESSVSVLLIGATLLAMVAANTSLKMFYDMLLDVPLTVSVGSLALSKPLLLWINDGLMAIFFLLIGLEVKREFMVGELSQRSQMILPAMAAVGGMVVPALCYVALNQGDPAALKGWAIPSATDIAFSLGVLALLGSRIPPALKIFLMALAIIDDLGAIAVIALFYTSELSVMSISLALGCLLVLIVLNRMGTRHLGPYMVIGIIMWICVLKSGVHATLAGVALAFTIPLKADGSQSASPLKRLEQALHGWVNFCIIPIFAFANAGITLGSDQFETILSPVSMGVIVGLVIGKQVGVFLFTWLAVASGCTRLPNGVGWQHIYGVALLCGIGFTMSFFIASLAFEQNGAHYLIDSRTGILLGSLVSALSGYMVLHSCRSPGSESQAAAQVSCRGEV